MRHFSSLCSLVGLTSLGVATVRVRSTSEPKLDSDEVIKKWAIGTEYNQCEFNATKINGIVRTPFPASDTVRFLQNNFDLRSDDVVIATYPKCGTTWTQQIMCNILYHVDHRNDIQTSFYQDKSFLKSPSMERHFENDEFYEQYIKDTESVPRVLKTHCTVDIFPVRNIHPNAKLIIVLRDPKDVMISFLKYFPFTDARLKCDITACYKMFLCGLFYGSFWDHYYGFWKQWMADDSFSFRGNIGGYQQSNGERRAFKQDNILWLYYEDMICDLPTEIQKIITFLGYDSLLDDHDLSDIVANCSKEAMIKASKQSNVGYQSHLVRKGVIGDHQNYLSAEQSQWIDFVTQVKFGGTSIQYQKWENHQ